MDRSNKSWLQWTAPISCCSAAGGEPAHSSRLPPEGFTAAEATKTRPLSDCRFALARVKRWRTPSAMRTHMHAPDKPAFLSGSGRAAPFLSLPFCPGQRMMGCQKGIWGFQIRYAPPQPPNAPVYGKQGAAANNKLKVGACYATDGPAFKITLGGWVIMNWERTINSRLLRNLAAIYSSPQLEWSKTQLVCLGRILFQANGWKPCADQSMTRQCQ